MISSKSLIFHGDGFSRTSCQVSQQVPWSPAFCCKHFLRCLPSGLLCLCFPLIIRFLSLATMKPVQLSVCVCFFHVLLMLSSNIGLNICNVLMNPSRMQFVYWGIAILGWAFVFILNFINVHVCQLANIWSKIYFIKSSLCLY